MPLAYNPSDEARLAEYDEQRAKARRTIHVEHSAYDGIADVRYHEQLIGLLLYAEGYGWGPSPAFAQRWNIPSMACYADLDIAERQLRGLLDRALTRQHALREHLIEVVRGPSAVSDWPEPTGRTDKSFAACSVAAEYSGLDGPGMQVGGNSDLHAYLEEREAALAAYEGE